MGNGVEIQSHTVLAVGTFTLDVPDAYQFDRPFERMENLIAKELWAVPIKAPIPGLPAYPLSPSDSKKILESFHPRRDWIDPNQTWWDAIQSAQVRKQDSEERNESFMDGEVQQDKKDKLKLQELIEAKTSTRRHFLVFWTDVGRHQTKARPADEKEMKQYLLIEEGMWIPAEGVQPQRDEGTRSSSGDSSRAGYWLTLTQCCWSIGEGPDG